MNIGECHLNSKRHKIWFRIYKKHKCNAEELNELFSMQVMNSYEIEWLLIIFSISFLPIRFDKDQRKVLLEAILKLESKF